MLVTGDIAELRAAVAEARRGGARIGCVPTMGALHAGHASLLQAARAETDFVVATIFVNPLQFGPHEDLARYPRPLDADLALCRTHATDAVFVPAAETLYPPGFATGVDVAGLSTILEGAVRPGHFRGVATVVLKLLLVVQPDVAFFGRKDYQQQLLVRRMCADLDVPATIRTCPTVRDGDGLALSSRNVYLSSEQRRQALALPRALEAARRAIEEHGTDAAGAEAALQAELAAAEGLALDYAVIVDAETLGAADPSRTDLVALAAVKVGTTRLIDNVLIRRTSASAGRGV